LRAVEHLPRKGKALYSNPSTAGAGGGEERKKGLRKKQREGAQYIILQHFSIRDTEKRFRDLQVEAGPMCPEVVRAEMRWVGLRYHLLPEYITAPLDGMYLDWKCRTGERTGPYVFLFCLFYFV
jgi:hypothetical protein